MIVSLHLDLKSGGIHHFFITVFPDSIPEAKHFARPVVQWKESLREAGMVLQSNGKTC